MYVGPRKDYIEQSFLLSNGCLGKVVTLPGPHGGGLVVDFDCNKQHRCASSRRAPYPAPLVEV